MRDAFGLASRSLTMMRLCEINFTLLCRLMPGEKRQGALTIWQIKRQKYQITIEELTRYTKLISIRQLTSLINYCCLPTINVRVYYDARVAEVCSTQQISRFKARYDYPNATMCQPDEKCQINQSLTDWLHHCVVYGALADES